MAYENKLAKGWDDIKSIGLRDAILMRTLGPWLELWDSQDDAPNERLAVISLHH